MQECKDRVTSNDDVDCQLLHRFVRIPFTIGYFNGALKMTMAVSNDRRKGEVLRIHTPPRFEKFVQDYTYNYVPFR